MLLSAFVIGVLVNMIVVFVLALINQSAELSAEPIQVLARADSFRDNLDETDLAKREITHSTDAAASAAAAAPLSAVSVMEIAAASPVALPSLPDTTPQLEILGTKVNSFGTAFTANIDPGRVERGSGNGQLFGGAGMGNGENIAVLADVSGSMKKHTTSVARLIKKRYPNITKDTVVGCWMRRRAEPLEKIAELAKRDNIDVVVFICDLQDKLDEEGMLELWDALHPGDRQVRLEIISFQKKPRPQLADLLEQVDGCVYHGEETIERLVHSISQQRRRR